MANLENAMIQSENVIQLNLIDNVFTSIDSKSYQVIFLDLIVNY